MFGYIKPLIPELKVKDKELYQAYYCGLCRALGKYGLTSRTALTYDATFAALLLTAAGTDPVPPEFKLHGCPLHPSRGKTPCAQRTDVLDYCAGVCVLLAKYKLLDDARDGRPLRRCYLPLYTHGAKKAEAAYPAAAEALKRSMEKLNAVEAENSADTDAAPILFGSLLAELICAYPGLAEEQRRVTAELCRAIGGFIYAADAWDDRADDRKRGCYNIFNNMEERPAEEAAAEAEESAEGTSPAEAEEGAEGASPAEKRVKEAAEAMLDMYINSAALAYDLLELRFCKPLLDNVIYLGLRNTADTVLAGKEGDK